LALHECGLSLLHPRGNRWEIEGKNPLCACGSIMKKEYSAPVFQYLDFLRFPEPALARKDPPEQ
jgi:hypothetical protein